MRRGEVGRGETDMIRSNASNIWPYVIAGSAIGGIRETQEMLDFCSKNNVACDVELIPIQKVNEAYERVVKSDIRYRFVIDIANSLECKD